VRRLKPATAPYLVWDTYQRGLAVRVQPKGTKFWKVIYSRGGRPRWLTIGDACAICLSDARQMAAEVMLDVARGRDPQAERRAERGKGTLAELAERYLEQHAKRKNKSWEQADYLVRRHLLPRLGKLRAADVSKADVRGAIERVASPTVANQTLAAASAIFSWAIAEEIGGVKSNPCSKVARHEVKSRERVLSASEVPLFWRAFDSVGLVASTALKLILLTGQRPGEVAHMRREHIKDGWWEMPGEPDPTSGWPGTKNGASHRVWLPNAAQALLAELEAVATGHVFASARGYPIKVLDAAMRTICGELGIAEKVTPHDLRRTHGSTITALGFGRDAMNRIQNHREGGIASVYDRHGYAEETKRVMEAVATHIMALAERQLAVGKVVPFR
jgi:integrase